MGMKTAIFTISLDNIGVTSYNSSLGGPAKLHLAREIDAFGGEMGRNKGNVENIHRILRGYIPKGVDLSNYS